MHATQYDSGNIIHMSQRTYVTYIKFTWLSFITMEVKQKVARDVESWCAVKRKRLTRETCVVIEKHVLLVILVNVRQKKMRILKYLCINSMISAGTQRSRVVTRVEYV